MKDLSDYIKESTIVKSVKKQLEEKLSAQDGYEVLSEVRWGDTSKRMVLDIVVKKNGVILSIFEIKMYIKSVEMAELQIRTYISSIHAYLFVIYCHETGSYTTYCEQKSEEYKSLDPIIVKIKEIGQHKCSEKKSKYYVDESVNAEDLAFFKNSEKILDPEWCREKLENFQDDKICRYSSIDSLFNTLKFSTLRMNGLPGMNDKKEGLFAWNLIYKANETDNEENKRRKRDINDVFIVSFSSKNKIDDLTQWRLYGDDAKGVCCIYSIQREKVRERFFLHKVRYITPSKEGEELSDNLLKSFRKYIKQNFNINYSDLSPAIFFYKPDSYDAEDEVRLLVDNKKTTAYKTPEYKRDWLLTNANTIPNPYIDVPLNDIPLKIEKILLGPNMSDVDTIQAQLETMLEQYGIEAIVDLSEIKSYRNPNK